MNDVVREMKNNVYPGIKLTNNVTVNVCLLFAGDVVL
jgi:hypothetical protein